MKRIHPRTILVFCHDLAAIVAAWLGAHWLRFNLSVPVEFLAAATQNLYWVVPLQALIFWRFGLYRGLWRFASLPDLKRILMAVATASVAAPVILTLFKIEVVVPRSVLLLDPILLLLIMGGSRFAYRSWKEHRLLNLSRLKDKPVLILGAGSAADFLLREMARSKSGFRAIGLLDDDPDKIGRHVHGVAVLGALRDLALWAKRTDIEHVILALPTASHSLRKSLTEICSEIGVKVLTVPSLEDLMSGRVTISGLRPIELEDLLGRDPVSLDNAGLAECLTQRVVMVTGAGGSIGSELCRQIARFRPSCLILFEQSEFALYQLEQEFLSCCPDQQIICMVGSVCDSPRIREVVARLKPAVIYHAAAYKHVPMMEKGNSLQALRNNVVGTAVVARAAVDHDVEKFVMVSTDKAVNPTNVMGASKRLAEMVCQSMNGLGTKFISVRFGNVLGSSGSVIPKFQKQIEAGGPVTVTHPDITRYFMSIPEAAQLVLQAGLMGQGGEIFVLDMGEPVRIADLARLMIRLSGKREDEITIEYVGLRPGEKLYEELLADAESTLPTPHAKLRVARARQGDAREVDRFVQWISSTTTADDDVVRSKLKEWVPEYQPAVTTTGGAPSEPLTSSRMPSHSGGAGMVHNERKASAPAPSLVN